MTAAHFLGFVCAGDGLEDLRSVRRACAFLEIVLSVADIAVGCVDRLAKLRQVLELLATSIPQGLQVGLPRQLVQENIILRHDPVRARCACEELYLPEEWSVVEEQHVVVLVFDHVVLQVDRGVLAHAQHDVGEVGGVLQVVGFVVVEFLCVDLVLLVDQVAHQVTGLGDLEHDLFDESAVAVLVDVEGVGADFEVFDEFLVDLSVEADLQVVWQ